MNTYKAYIPKDDLETTGSKNIHITFDEFYMKLEHVAIGLYPVGTFTKNGIKYGIMRFETYKSFTGGIDGGNKGN